MSKKKMVDVYLLPEAVKLLAENNMYFLKPGGYFRCLKMEYDGPFLKMVIPVQYPKVKKLFYASLSIPCSFVMYILTDGETLKSKAPGFAIEK